ncbi:alkaline phosphatase family protein [Schleiferiaceae bacterium]|nr:alkaline phosphatase family protein [Schleiferiaceae bacterium]
MIILALNELNIEYIKGYVNEGQLPNFGRLLEHGVVRTTSETAYEHLEPWIQWTTVHTGKTFDEHRVFRLGDIVDRADLVQIFEVLEEAGVSVGAISPFNADNRLSKAKFFLPDPWTQSKTSGGYFLGRLSRTVSRFVNNNASGKVDPRDVIWLLFSFIIYARVKRWPKFFELLRLRKKPGVKAAVLDMILLEVFVTLQKKHKPDYSHLFFNGGAHVQHHYMFNSSQYKGNYKNPEWYCPHDWDPIFMMLDTYDTIIGDLLKSGERIIGITGLHQVPHEEQTFYWRPLDHNEFLLECGVEEEFNVIPRMSRDFLIEVSSEWQALKIESHLNQFTDSVRSKPVFNIDNRGKSLFVEIVYDDDLVDDLSFNGPNENKIESLRLKLAFVAIKNGKHNGLGYLFSNMPMNIPKQIELKDVYSVISNYALTDKLT